MDKDTIIARQAMSARHWKELQDEAWQKEYQAKCDKLYWSKGQCCAGCDHWVSDQGFVGQCMASGIVPGMDVMLSAGIHWSSHAWVPGHPFSNAHDWCGKFRDDFDWSALEMDYQESVGVRPEKPKDKI